MKKRLKRMVSLLLMTMMIFGMLDLNTTTVQAGSVKSKVDETDYNGDYQAVCTYEMWEWSGTTVTSTIVKDKDTSKSTSSSDNPLKLKDAGEYDISWHTNNLVGTQTGHGTYSVTINPLTATLSWNVPTDWTYGDTYKAVTATVSNLCSGDTATVTVDASDVSAGTHTATATGISNTNYALPADKTTSYTIAPRQLSITNLAVSKTYDGTLDASSAVSFQLDGVVGSDDVQAVIQSASFDSADAGTGKNGSVTFKLEGGAASNYTFASDGSAQDTVTVSFSDGVINQKSIEGANVTLDNDRFTYDGETKTPEVSSVTLNDWDNEITYDKDGDISAKDASDYTLKVIGNGNYTDTVEKTWSIAKKTITASDLEWSVPDTWYYGDTDKTVTATIKDGILADGDSLTVEVALESTDAGTHQATATALYTGTGDDKQISTNYVLEGTPSTEYTISPRILTPGLGLKEGVTSLTREYDGTKTVDEALAGNIAINLSNIAAQDAGKVGAAASYAYDKPGVDATKIIASDITLTGDEAVIKNYTLEATDTLDITASITQTKNAWINAPSLNGWTGWTYGDYTKDTALEAIAEHLSYQALYGTDADNDTAKITYLRYYEDAEGKVKSESVAVPVDAGSYGVRVYVPVTDDYMTLSGYAGEFTISPKNIAADGVKTEINATIDESRVGTARIIGVAVTVDGISLDEGDYTYEVTRNTEKKDGEILPVTITVRGQGNYTGEKQITYDVGKAKQADLTVSPDSKGSVQADESGDYIIYTYGDAPKLTLGGGSTDGEVTWEISEEDKEYASIAETSGKELSLKLNKVTGDGLVKVTATQAGNDDYNDEAISVRIKIQPKELTVTAGDNSKKYSEPDPELTCEAEGLLDEDEINLGDKDVLTGSLTRADGYQVGDYEIEQGTIALNPDADVLNNYVLKFIKGTFTIEENPGATIDVVSYNEETGEKTTDSIDDTDNVVKTVTEGTDADGNEKITTTLYDENQNRTETTETVKTDDATTETVTSYETVDGEEHKTGFIETVITENEAGDTETVVTTELSYYIWDGEDKIAESYITDSEGNVEHLTYREDGTGAYVKEGFDPTLIEGDGSKYDGSESLTFRSDDVLVNFVEVYVENKLISPENYDVVNGSIKVTLKQSYLDTLAAGTYHIAIQSTNGNAEGTFTVIKKEADKTIDSGKKDTGDTKKQSDNVAKTTGGTPQKVTGNIINTSGQTSAAATDAAIGTGGGQESVAEGVTTDIAASRTSVSDSAIDTDIAEGVAADDSEPVKQVAGKMIDPPADPDEEAAEDAGAVILADSAQGSFTFLWIVLLLAAAGAFIIIFIYRRKNENKED